VENDDLLVGRRRLALLAALAALVVIAVTGGWLIFLHIEAQIAIEKAIADGQRLEWIPNLEEGLSAAREEKRRIFIDFTGIT
jgi:hypothetical protein